jgi:hypothetical protein
MDEDSTLRSKEKRKEAAIHGPAIRRLLHCGSSWVRVVAVHPPLCHDLSNVKVRIVRGVDSFIATGDPLLMSISNLRKERKKGNLKYMFKACVI